MSAYASRGVVMPVRCGLNLAATPLMALYRFRPISTKTDLICAAVVFDVGLTVQNYLVSPPCVILATTPQRIGRQVRMDTLQASRTWFVTGTLAKSNDVTRMSHRLFLLCSSAAVRRLLPHAK